MPRQRPILAVTRAYAALAGGDRHAFADLLQAVRTRAVVQVCPMVISALRNVARFAASYVRPLSDWPGATGTMYPVIDSLVQHLLARYPVPHFLVSVWYGAGTDDNRRWFVAHAAGKRFRDLDLPLVMTRRMESIFLGCVRLPGPGGGLAPRRATFAGRQGRFRGRGASDAAWVRAVECGFLADGDGVLLRARLRSARPGRCRTHRRFPSGRSPRARRGDDWPGAATGSTAGARLLNQGTLARLPPTAGRCVGTGGWGDRSQARSYGRDRDNNPSRSKNGASTPRYRPCGGSSSS